MLVTEGSIPDWGRAYMSECLMWVFLISIPCNPEYGGPLDKPQTLNP